MKSLQQILSLTKSCRVSTREEQIEPFFFLSLKAHVENIENMKKKVISVGNVLLYFWDI